MPRIVNLDAPADSGPRVRRRSAAGDWTPYEDWTSHHFKPSSQLSETRTDYSGTLAGRDVMHGKRGGRTMPTMPGGKGTFNAPTWATQ